jgi:hypothetical protein
MKQNVEKIDMAFEQLDDALKAYFDGRYHSATVLAGASEQLLAGYVMKHNLTPAWKQARSSITKIANGLRSLQEMDPTPTTEKDIGDLLNHVYNHSKHAGKAEHVIWFDPRFEAQQLIDRAIANFDALFALSDYRDLPDLPLVQRFVRESAEAVRAEEPEEHDQA